jgi:hypothetical protein
MVLGAELLEESVDCHVLERKEIVSCLFIGEIIMGNRRRYNDNRK